MTSCFELLKSMPSISSTEKSLPDASGRRSPRLRRRGRGESWQRRGTSTLEKYLLQHPQKEALCRSIDGTCLAGLVGHRSTAFVARCSPAGFQNLVKCKLKYVPK